MFGIIWGVRDSSLIYINYLNHFLNAYIYSLWVGKGRRLNRSYLQEKGADVSVQEQEQE